MTALPGPLLAGVREALMQEIAGKMGRVVQRLMAIQQSRIWQQSAFVRFRRCPFSFKRILAWLNARNHCRATSQSSWSTIRGACRDERCYCGSRGSGDQR